MKLSTISIPLIVIFSLLIALSTLRVFPLGLDIAFQGMAHQISNAKLGFLLHIFGSSAALALGAFQIIKYIRTRHLPLHKWVGRFYAVSVAIGGFSGLWIAFQVNGIVAIVGFALLAILWLIITVKAILFARARKIAQHRRWMICSFALTFSAVTLRVQLAIFMFGFAVPYSDVYTYLAWSSWLINLVIALWYIRRNPAL